MGSLLVSATQLVLIEDFGVNVPFDGLVLLRIGGLSGGAGIGPERNIAFSCENGQVTAVHQCDRTSALYELETPIYLETESETPSYRAAWVSGNPKALRADLGVSDYIMRETRDRLVFGSAVSVVEVANLYSFKASDAIAPEIPENALLHDLGDGSPLTHDLGDNSILIHDLVS